jgi:hypothetical protein
MVEDILPKKGVTYTRTLEEVQVKTRSMILYRYRNGVGHQMVLAVIFQ